jgi:outer membrane protein assembly factor BamB
MTGCRVRTVSATVNSTFVDVDGLLVAPTKIAASYSTEDLHLGDDSWAGTPQLLDGTLYTFSYRSDLSQWTTAWDQATGKKLWSVPTNVDTNLSPSAAFTTDGTHLFFVRTDISTLGEPGVVASIACLDRATGATVWQSTPTVASSLVFGVRSNIAVHIDGRSHAADRVYVIGAEERTSTATPPVDEVRNPGIWIWDAATGTLQGRIDWAALSTHPEASGQLLCDGVTLYASIPESFAQLLPQQPAYPAAIHSVIVAFDLATNKAIWTEIASGEGTDLVKQGDVLVLPRAAQDYNGNPEYWIDAWKSALPTAPGDTMRLWSHQVPMAPVRFAVDDLHVYVQGDKGILTAFDLTTGTQAWSHQFAPYKAPVTDGPDMGMLVDRYPDMTLTTTRNVLYVQDGGGLIVALAPATGTELWNKRISHVVWGQTYIANLFVMKPVDNGFVVIASSGKVDVWKQQ